MLLGLIKAARDSQFGKPAALKIEFLEKRNCGAVTRGNCCCSLRMEWLLLEKRNPGFGGVRANGSTGTKVLLVLFNEFKALLPSVLVEWWKGLQTNERHRWKVLAVICLPFKCSLEGVIGNVAASHPNRNTEPSLTGNLAGAKGIRGCYNISLLKS